VEGKDCDDSTDGGAGTPGYVFAWSVQASAAVGAADAVAVAYETEDEVDATDSNTASQMRIPRRCSRFLASWTSNRRSPGK
jgi:hypothetical protein